MTLGFQSLPIHKILAKTLTKLCKTDFPTRNIFYKILVRYNKPGSVLFREPVKLKLALITLLVTFAIFWEVPKYLGRILALKEHLRILQESYRNLVRLYMFLLRFYIRTLQESGRNPKGSLWYIKSTLFVVPQKIFINGVKAFTKPFSGTTNKNKNKNILYRRLSITQALEISNSMQTLLKTFDKLNSFTDLFREKLIEIQIQ